MAADCADTCVLAQPARRRVLNQAFITRILIHTDPDTRQPEVGGAELQPLFEKALDSALPARLGIPEDRQGQRTREIKNRGPVSVAHGSRKNDLVEVSGLEPPASSLRTKRSSQLSYTPALGTPG